MKLKNLVFLFAVLMLAACQPKLDVADVPDTGSLSADSESVTIKFTTNQEWRVEIDKPWLKVDKNSGQKGENQIVATAETNPDYDSREAHLKIIAGELVKDFKFTQEEALGVVADVTDFVCPDEEGTVEIPVRANTDIEVTLAGGAKDWIELVQTKGLLSKAILLKLKANDMYEQRIGRVTIAAGRDIRGIKITQIERAGLFAEKITFDADPKGASINMPLKTNVDYDVEIVEGGDWISVIDRGRNQTKALTDYTMVVKVEANGTYNDRKGVVRLTSTAGTLDFVINQAHNPEIIADDGYLVGPESGILTIPFQSTSGEFVATIVEGEDWLSCVETKGLSSHNVVLNYKFNDTDEFRVAWLRIKSDRINKDIAIIQQTFAETLEYIEYVDLGLPSGVLWANKNIGASSPLSVGQYFQWGITEGYYPDSFKDMDEAGYNNKLNKSSAAYPFLEALNDEVSELPFDYDVAYQLLGEGKRMPTAEEYQELYDNCTFERCVTEDGKGYIEAVSKINGNSIIFPYGGKYKVDEFYGVNQEGSYWSCSSCDSYDSNGEFIGLRGTLSHPGKPILFGTARYIAMSVRPVVSYNRTTRAHLKLDDLAIGDNGPMFKYSVLTETNDNSSYNVNLYCELYEVDEQGKKILLGICVDENSPDNWGIYDSWCSSYYDGTDLVALEYDKTYAVRAFIEDNFNITVSSNAIHFTTPSPDVEVKFAETQLYNGNNIYVEASAKSETKTIEKGGFIIEKLDASTGKWNYLRQETARLIESGDEFIFRTNFENLELNTSYRIAAFVTTDKGAKTWKSGYVQYTTRYVPEVLVDLDKAEFVAPNKIVMEGIAYSEDPKYPLTEMGFRIEKQAADGRWEHVETYFVEDIQDPRFSYEFECEYNSNYSIRSFGIIDRERLDLEDFYWGEWYSEPITVFTGGEYKEPTIILSDPIMRGNTIELYAVVKNNNEVDEYPIFKSGFICEAYVDGRKIEEFTLDPSFYGNSIMSSIKQIIPGAVYKVKAFVTDKVDTYYSDTKEYIAEEVKPSITVEMTSDLISPATTADSYVSGKVTPADYSVIDGIGAVWGKEENPTVTENNWSPAKFDQDGTFNAWVYTANLAPGTYYIRLYATGIDGTTVYSSRQIKLVKE